MIAAERSPPHSFEAEQALLGAILMSNRSLERVSEFLRPEHFASSVHGRIYKACLTLTGRNQIATPVTLKTYLAQDPGLKELGGDAYLMNLAAAAASIINAEDYGKLIFDLALRRDLIGLGEDLVNEAFDPDLNASAIDIVERSEQTLAALVENGTADRGARHAADVMPAMIAASRIAQERGGCGIATGLADLDEKLGGMGPGNLLILAGRPGMGKSAIAPCIARHVAGHDGSVLYVSLEMTCEEVGQRLAAAEASVPFEVIKNGSADDDQWSRVNDAAAVISKLPIYIDDGCGLKVEQLRARVRRIDRRHLLRLVIIDHIGLIAMGENRLQGLTHISGTLKRLAKELNVPVIAISQLNRGVESRDDKRPLLSDLRESGSIEQDADAVMFVYRKHYYLEQAEPQRSPKQSDSEYWAAMADWHESCRAEQNRAQIIIGKNRHGRTGTINLWCDMATSRFGSLANSQGDR